MSSDDPFLRLQDFVAWVRKRRPIQKDAWVDEQTLECVTQGIERFLEGKNPWPRQQGNRPKRSTMWKCYWKATFAGRGESHLPQHKDTGGAYKIVGDELNLSAGAVESHVRNARALLDTPKGRLDFLHWLSKNVYGPKGLSVVMFEPDHPMAKAELKRREESGVVTRRIRSARKAMR